MHVDILTIRFMMANAIMVLSVVGGGVALQRIKAGMLDGSNH